MVWSEVGDEDGGLVAGVEDGREGSEEWRGGELEDSEAESRVSYSVYH